LEMRVATLSLLPLSASALIAPRSTQPRRSTKVDGRVTREEVEGELSYISLTHDSGASAKVYPFGADVCSFKDADGTEWIAVRPDAKMDGSKPISGGLSHCFPQFGPGEIQQHGFARNVDWKFGGWTEGANPSITFLLNPNSYTKPIWDKQFSCEFVVTLNENSLDTKYVVKNCGEEAYDFQAALHSYFDVSDVEEIEIAGSFAGKAFLDKTKEPPATTTESRAAVTIDGAYDRVYSGVADPVLVDKAKGKKLNIKNTAGWKDTVIWSPFGDEGMGYKNFVCVESVAFEPVSLAPGAEWVGDMSLVPEKL